MTTQNNPKTDLKPVNFESTPNPQTLKFNLQFQFQEVGFECKSFDESERSPLAQKLFGFPWAASVFLGTDSISVTKQDWVDWEILAKPLANLIQEHISSGQPLVIIGDLKTDDADENDSDVVKKIKALIKTEIQPVVALDGGQIVFDRFENGILSVQMKGSCAGCPSSAATLKDGIEVRMKEMIPEVKEVVAV
ncbi:MAG: NifU family protein [Pseudobdellovibrionaceae bacterium]